MAWRTVLRPGKPGYFLRRIIELMNLRVLICVVSSIAWTAVGCGPSTGKVSGTVSVGGKPVPAGLITFRPDDPAANTVSAELDREGRFSIELPVGPCRVALDNREYQPRPKAGAGVPSGIALSPEVMAKLRQSSAASTPPPEIDPTKTADAPPPRESGLYIPLPEKYYQVESSGLTFTVEPGEKTQDFKL